MHSASVFFLISVLSLLFFYKSGQLRNGVLPGILAWVCLVGGLAYTGFFTSDPRRFIGVMVGLTAGIVFLLRISPKAPPAMQWFLALHGLRVGVEWVLHELYLQGLIPRSMTWEGWNFDVFFGLSACILLVLQWSRIQPLPRIFWRIWNITGLAFLAWIVAIAVLSAPLPLQQLAFDQPNRAILHFPYCLLPALVVPLVAMAHIRALNPDSALELRHERLKGKKSATSLRNS